jgi:hypothetical protein
VPIPEVSYSLEQDFKSRRRGEIQTRSTSDTISGLASFAAKQFVQEMAYNIRKHHGNTRRREYLVPSCLQQRPGKSTAAAAGVATTHKINSHLLFHHFLDIQRHSYVNATSTPSAGDNPMVYVCLSAPTRSLGIPGASRMLGYA